MRQFIIFLIFQCTVTCLLGQNYFNKHFKVGPSNITTSELKFYKGEIITTYLSFDENGNAQSGTSSFDLNGNKLNSHNFPNIFAAYDGLNIIGNDLFLFGKKRDNNKSINVQKFKDGDFLKEDELSFNTEFDNSFPYGTAKYNGSIYGAYTDEISEDDVRQTGVFKFDTDLNLIWNRKINTHYSRSSNSGIEIFSNGNLVQSSLIFNFSDFYEASRLTLISSDGTVLDSIDSGEDILQSEGRRIRTTVLNNDILVQAHKVDQGLDHPIRINFYNSDLDFLYRKYLPSKQALRISPLRVTAGRGDYFFILGYFTDFETSKQVGIIVKMSSTGDLLWRHHYQHPDFMEDGIFHVVYDVEEDNNGDIYCLGNVKPQGEQQELWLFKINEHGCFGADECPEEVIITSTDDPVLDDVQVDVFPNPTTDLVTVQSQALKMDRVSCFDLNGKLVLSKDINATRGVFSLSAYSEGVYSVRIRFSDGQEVTRLVVKEK